MSQSWQFEPAAILDEQLKVGDHEALMLESWLSTLWWGLVLKVKILKYSSLMLCMYAPVSIRKCLACVFSVFRVKKERKWVLLFSLLEVGRDPDFCSPPISLPLLLLSVYWAHWCLAITAPTSRTVTPLPGAEPWGRLWNLVFSTEFSDYIHLCFQ